jgi:hypothetical protein
LPLTEWRRYRKAGILDTLTPARRGPKESEANPLEAEWSLRLSRKAPAFGSACSALKRSSTSEKSPAC